MYHILSPLMFGWVSKSIQRAKYDILIYDCIYSWCLITVHMLLVRTCYLSKHQRETFFFYLYTVQITFIFIGQTHLVFGKRVCTCVTNTQTRFELFWIDLRIRNAFGTFGTFETQILICDLWVLGGFSFGFGFSFRNSWWNPFERWYAM